MTYNARDIHGPTQSKAITDLIQSIFITELINPSKEIWFAFAWISNIDILDNTTRKFNSSHPEWPATHIKLDFILSSLLSTGTNLRFIIRRDGHNNYFIDKLNKLKKDYFDQLKWIIEPDFHLKGLVGEDYSLSGSMNLTNRGISSNDEHIIFRTHPSVVSQHRIELKEKWENKML